MSDDELIGRYLEPNPHKPSLAEVWLKGSGIPVWALIGAFPGVDRNSERLAELYGVPLDAVRAALAFYERNRCLIDARIEENEAAIDWPYAVVNG
jgi:uncharacterized protein (DUF433 family)